MLFAVATLQAGSTLAPFTEEAIARGLDFSMSAYPQSQGYLGQGAGFADLDADGDPDVVLLGAVSGRVGIFENLGDGYFVDRSMTSGIPLLVEQEGFAAADFDADGRIDLYLTQHKAPNKLMRNLGGFQFIDVSVAAHVDDDGPGTGAAWGDFDGDGWLDLYACNYSAFAPFNDNAMFHNLGDGTFADEGPEYGTDSDALSFQSVWSDYDKDGDADLYLSNDRGPLGYTPNQLWRNDGASFTDVSAPSGANVSLFSMGLAAGDFDGNGFPDYYTTNIFSQSYPGINPLLLNQGDGTFVESAEAAGVANYITSWGAIFFDFDNNGHKDLYVNNMFVPNTLYSNDGVFPCEEIAGAAGVQASHHPSNIVSFTSAVADVDGDGDIDLLVNNVGYRAELFINHEGSTRNHVRFAVVGEYPNLDAIGAQVETTASGVTHFDEIYAGGNGYLGQNERIVHVGLGALERVDQVEVRWPGGGPVRTLTDLPVNERWSIYPPSRLCDAEGDGALGPSDFEAFADCFAGGFAPGCEMMDWNGNSSIYAEDLYGCFVETASDCNGNGQEDRVELLFAPGLDADTDGTIDCCDEPATPYPNEVGPTLTVAKTGAGEADLMWTIPPVDALHDAATSFDVYRSSTAATGFGLLAGVSEPTHLDSVGSAAAAYYLVNARNACGSSGEEPF